MNRIGIVLLTGFLTLSCFNAQAEGGLFIFPHTDLNRPTGAPKAVSFGTLLEFIPPGVEELQEIPDALLHSHMAPNHPVRRLLDEGFATRAGEVASARLERLMELQDTAQDRESDDIFEARLDLGVAMYADGHPQRAVPLLKRGLERLRRQVDWFNPRWLGPLTALGLAQQQLEQHEDANRTLARAQVLIQRHNGTHDARQLPLMLSRAQSLGALTETFDTEQLYRTHLKLVEANNSPHSTERLAAVHMLSEWLAGTGQFKKAISAFNSLLEAQNDAPAIEKNVVVTQATLMALSQLYLLQGNLEVDRGLRLARRASQLVLDNPNAFEPLQQVQAHLFAGDWLTLFGRRRAAAAEYSLAWSAAGRSPGAADIKRSLAQPSMIFEGPEVPLSEMGYQWTHQHAYANFHMSIRSDGRPAQVRLTNTNMHGTTIRRAQQLMRQARFRPAIVDGKPVLVENLQYNRIYDTAPFDGFTGNELKGLLARNLNPR